MRYMDCYYCGAPAMRKKIAQDWKQGDAQRTGHHPSIGDYLYCERCGRSCIKVTS